MNNNYEESITLPEHTGQISMSRNTQGHSNTHTYLPSIEGALHPALYETIDAQGHANDDKHKQMVRQLQRERSLERVPLPGPYSLNSKDNPYIQNFQTPNLMS